MFNILSESKNLSTKQSTYVKSELLSYLSDARRRVLYERTLAKFEMQFTFALYDAEKEYLAERLQITDSNDLKDSLKIQKKKEIAQREEVLEKEMKNVSEKMKENIEDEEEDEQEKKVERWLQTEWESLVKDLKQSDPQIDWDVGF